MVNSRLLVESDYLQPFPCPPLGLLCLLSEAMNQTLNGRPRFQNLPLYELCGILVADHGHELSPIKQMRAHQILR